MLIFYSRFWYRFIPDNIALIQNETGERAYKKIEPRISEFTGKVFLDICKQYLWKLNAAEESPVDFLSIGRWCGNDSLKKQKAEIDFLAFDAKKHAIFGECKWTNEKIGTDVPEALIERSRLFGYPKKYFFLFAKTGFTGKLISEAAAAGDVTLTAFDDIYIIIKTGHDQPSSAGREHHPVCCRQFRSCDEPIKVKGA